MKIAGFFDIWYDQNRSPIYSFTIITQESGRKLYWMHKRSPAILESDVRDWLDFERVPAFESLKLIKQPKNVMWYRVSNHVNNPNNKTEECIQPLKEVPEGEPEKSNVKRNLKRKNSDEMTVYRKKRWAMPATLKPNWLKFHSIAIFIIQICLNFHKILK